MKTYVVQFPPNETIGHEAVVDTFLRGFALAIKASSNYRWINLNMGSSTGPRMFDTNCEKAAVALKLELSNIGVQVFEQPELTELCANDENWRRADARCW